MAVLALRRTKEGTLKWHFVVTLWSGALNKLVLMGYQCFREVSTLMEGLHIGSVRTYTWMISKAVSGVWNLCCGMGWMLCVRI